MRTALKKVRVPDLAAMKKRGEWIVMLTAYDAIIARLLDGAGIDVLLVGDSLGRVILGLDTTIPVTLDAMLHHTLAVTRGASRSLVVADMPFLTYQVSAEQAMQNAARLFQEGGAATVKLEGGRSIAGTVRRLTAAGLPVMGHIGLTPQHVHRLGGMRKQARDDKAEQELILDALALEDAGAFAVVLESIPDSVAEAVTSRLRIPTIGIGAGSHCDGQVLVSYDVLGLFDAFVPPFVKQYAQLGQQILNAVSHYAEDVRQGVFPPPILDGGAARPSRDVPCRPAPEDADRRPGRYFSLLVADPEYFIDFEFDDKDPIALVSRALRLLGLHRQAEAARGRGEAEAQRILLHQSRAGSEFRLQDGQPCDRRLPVNRIFAPSAASRRPRSPPLSRRAAPALAQLAQRPFAVGGGEGGGGASGGLTGWLLDEQSQLTHLIAGARARRCTATRPRSGASSASASPTAFSTPPGRDTARR